jgi:hypothetical protein
MPCYVPDVVSRIRHHLLASHKQAYWSERECLLHREVGDILGAKHCLCPSIACRIKLHRSSQVLPLGVIVLMRFNVNVFLME